MTSLDKRKLIGGVTLCVTALPMMAIAIALERAGVWIYDLSQKIAVNVMSYVEEDKNNG